ncbi:MAG: Ni,Fe-hydrogenase I cytochrome b subunit [Rhodanobacteraceae bacterium]|jgi:cytochrome b|nr:MAG: Ni,Fe-hydrogenase I cytochrome b subunit [Rhodanobacteraceae bacterium]
MDANPGPAAGRDTGPARPTVKVWDPLVRLLHWSLAACVFGAFLVEDGDAPHRILGYVALALVAVRVVWGLIGSEHARFRDWVRGPRAVRAYLRERLAGTSRRRLGHNPAAAVMMLVLLAGVVLVGVTGWMQTLDAFWGVAWVEDLHSVLAWCLLALIGLHVLAALVESFHYRENLIAAMIHGRKRALTRDERVE